VGDQDQDRDQPRLPVRVLRDLDLAALADIALILALAVAVVVVAERAVPWLLRRAGVRAERALLPLLPLVRLVVIAAAVGLIVPILVEPTLQNLVAIMGAVALALGFALKDYLSSVIAGVVATFERPYRRGDWVTLEGSYGVVRDVGFRAVQLVTLDDTVVTVPHNRIWENRVRNANDGGHTLMCVADFHVLPDHDAARARARLGDVALTSAYLAVDRPVVVAVSEHPWGTRYRLKAYPFDAAQQVAFVSDLTIRGKAELLALGCRLAALPALDGPPSDAAGRGGADG
jgi:small conductance mechanosensitive channel